MDGEGKRRLVFGSMGNIGLDASVLRQAVSQQLDLFSAMRSAKESYPIAVEGLELDVFPGVFPPGTDSVQLGRTFRVGPGETLLDSCAGSGVQSLLAAARGARVVAVDVSPQAVRNVLWNARKFGLEASIRACAGDLFPQARERFDVIVINPPYTNRTARDLVERACWDEGNRTLWSFLKRAHDYLAPGGRVYLSWANFADFGLLESAAARHGWGPALRSSITANERIYYRVYELTEIDTGRPGVPIKAASSST